MKVNRNFFRHGTIGTFISNILEFDNSVQPNTSLKPLYAKDTLDGVVSSELGWGLILYGEEEEDYLATTDGNGRGNYFQLLYPE